MSNTPQPVPPATEQPKIPDGGYAFPNPGILTSSSFAYMNSMTLRAYFAAAALQGLLANPSFGDMKSKILAHIAVEQADATIAVLKSGGAQ